MILVTGATGNVGSEVVDQLVKKGESLSLPLEPPESTMKLANCIVRKKSWSRTPVSNGHCCVPVHS